MEKSPWTESEILTYALWFGADQAASLLLMISPDRFQGDWEKVYAELTKGEN